MVGVEGSRYEGKLWYWAFEQVLHLGKMSGRKKILGKWKNMDSYAEEEMQEVGNMRVDFNRWINWVNMRNNE